MQAKRIQAVYYNNPDFLPPLINGFRILTGHSWTINLVCRNNIKPTNITYPNNTRIHRVESQSVTSWGEYIKFVVQVLRHSDRSTSVLWGHDMHGLLPARLLATRYRRPLVYQCHDYVPQNQAVTRGARVVRAFQQAFARTADIVIVPDADRGKVIAQELRLKKAPLVVANAPLMRPSTIGTALQTALAERGSQFDHIVFRQGTIGMGHAIEATLRSMPYWASTHWGFVLMGFSEQWYLDKLVVLARELGVEDRFVILPPVGYDQVAQFTRGADVGHALYEPVNINHVHATTASNKIMEYMQAGLPLLVSDTPAQRALATTYQCGVVADERSPQSIAMVINDLLSNPMRAQQLGMAAKCAFSEVFCFERQFAPALDALEALALRP